MSSDLKISSNRTNALASTGPSSAEGKATSSMNALKSGAFAAPTTVLPTEDPADLQRLEAEYFESWHPDGPNEEKLVRILISCDWLSRRYDRIEPVMIRISLDPSRSPEDAIAALFAQTKNSPLINLQRRRQHALNTWFRSLKELERLQKIRKEKEPVPVEAAPAPSPNPEVGFVPASLEPASQSVETAVVDPDIGR